MHAESSQKVYITVTNDLVTDQRVHRAAGTLTSSGTDVCVVGRLLPGSPGTGSLPYATKRLKLIFRKGFLFYAFFNFRLMLYLVTRKRITHVISNDLDTLPAGFIASRIRGAGLIYDSHELFTGVPELAGRKFVTAFWTRLERWLVPRVDLAYTVNDSIAGFYRKKYGKDFHVIRNVPPLQRVSLPFGLPAEVEDKKIVIYQGAVNVSRGIEEVIAAVKSMEGVVFIIAGAGDIFDDIQDLVRRESLEKKVILTGRIRPEYLHSLTSKAHLGVSCELNAGLNYYYALPNKLFSYIHAGIPVLTSAFPEMEKIVLGRQVGLTVEDPSDTENLSRIIREMLDDEKRQAFWRKNALLATKELCWENEQIKLQMLYNKAGIMTGLAEEGKQS